MVVITPGICVSDRVCVCVCEGRVSERVCESMCEREKCSNHFPSVLLLFLFLTLTVVDEAQLQVRLGLKTEEQVRTNTR